MSGDCLIGGGRRGGRGLQVIPGPPPHQPMGLSVPRPPSKCSASVLAGVTGADAKGKQRHIKGLAILLCLIPLCVSFIADAFCLWGLVTAVPHLEKSRCNCPDFHCHSPIHLSLPSRNASRKPCSHRLGSCRTQRFCEAVGGMGGSQAPRERPHPPFEHRTAAQKRLK